jgi:ATP-dependent Clp protease ATP-binding subunit ClpC
MVGIAGREEWSMFERFTEVARRVLFFARWELTELGGSAILPEHLLLGLSREHTGTAASLLSHATLTDEVVRLQVRLEQGEPIPATVEVPFDESTKRALLAAVSEADQMSSARVLSGHLLLGLLRDDTLPVFRILHGAGLRLKEAREQVAAAVARGDDESGPFDGVFEDESRE